jgi:hypothetical protein
MATRLEKSKPTATDGGDLKFAMALTRFLVQKIDLRTNLDSAYAGRKKTALKKVLREIPKTIDALKKFDQAFRTQWLRRNKSFGLRLAEVADDGGAALRRREVQLQTLSGQGGTAHR